MTNSRDTGAYRERLAIDLAERLKADGFDPAPAVGQVWHHHAISYLPAWQRRLVRITSIGNTVSGWECRAHAWNEPVETEDPGRSGLIKVKTLLAEYTPVEQTPLDLAAALDLTEAATPGPWKVRYDWCDCGEPYGCRHGEFAVKFGPFTYFDHQPAEQNLPATCNETTDAEFCAAARNILPVMLDELARRRAQVAAAYRFAQGMAESGMAGGSGFGARLRVALGKAEEVTP